MLIGFVNEIKTYVSYGKNSHDSTSTSFQNENVKMEEFRGSINEIATFYKAAIKKPQYNTRKSQVELFSHILKKTHVFFIEISHNE